MISTLLGSGLGSGFGLQNIISTKMGMGVCFAFLVYQVMIIIIKTYIIQMSYNKIWPKLTKNTGLDDTKFVPLTFNEAILVSILFS
tara:strand:- start:70 stop:327 length:258 start_codon:yes stop_codon:yes gene_type:complete